MNCIKNICSGQYWPGSEIDIGAWVDGNEVTATWVGCDTVICNDCHIAMDSKEPIDSKQIPILMPWELIKNRITKAQTFNDLSEAYRNFKGES